MAILNQGIRRTRRFANGSVHILFPDKSGLTFDSPAELRRFCREWWAQHRKAMALVCLMEKLGEAGNEDGVQNFSMTVDPSVM